MARLTPNTRITLAKRPEGMPVASDFAVEHVPAPTPGSGSGEVLLKTLYLSLDPYMRGRMSDRKSYAAPLEIGEVITGGVVAEVVASENTADPVGTLVTHHSGWQGYASPTRRTRPCPSSTPITLRLARPSASRLPGIRLLVCSASVSPSPERRWSSRQRPARWAPPWAGWPRPMDAK